MNSYFDKLFIVGVKNREKIITGFKLLYLLMILLIVGATISVYTFHSSSMFFYGLAEWFGRLALCTYVLTVIPGIYRRLTWKHKLVSLLMIFRRYIGISMSFFVLYHYLLLRGIDTLRSGKLPMLSVFETFGFVAFICVLIMGFTSNDISTNKLGVWWGRIHSITYGLLWLIFLHVALQSFSIWSALIGLTGIVQVLSFIVRWQRMRLLLTKPSV
jgi:DMSO/TMAO reductase YedYZ heme-binding membrane subunit